MLGGKGVFDVFLYILILRLELVSRSMDQQLGQTLPLASVNEVHYKPTNSKITDLSKMRSCNKDQGREGRC